MQIPRFIGEKFKLPSQLTLVQIVRLIWFSIYYHIVGVDNIEIRLSNGNEIRSTNVKKCADCKCNITKDNDSGWEVFVGGGYTQPTCKKCNEIRDKNLCEKSDL
jgi:hypothetical protein